MLLTSGDFFLFFSELSENSKLAHRLLLRWKTFTPILVFVRLFVFELGAHAEETETDGRQTDGRKTDGQGLYCGLFGRFKCDR